MEERSADREDALVERATRGDTDAVDRLLARHLPGLIGFVRRRAGDLARKESSSDIVQSVCREGLEGLSTGRVEYRGEEAFRSWLYEAALFKVQNRRRYWRAERRDAGREQDVEAGAAGDGRPRLEGLARTTRTPSREVVEREEVEGMRALLAELPERYRTVLHLARREELTHKEIAERMGITDEASRQLLNRALARLSTLVSRRFGDAAG